VRSIALYVVVASSFADAFAHNGFSLKEQTIFGQSSILKKVWRAL